MMGAPWIRRSESASVSGDLPHKKEPWGEGERKSGSYRGTAGKGPEVVPASVFEEQKEGKNGWSTVSMLQSVGAMMLSDVANVRSIGPCHQKFGFYSEW